MGKELSIDEIKSAVALATILPQLLERLDELNTKIDSLTSEFNKMKLMFNDNTKVVKNYLDKTSSISQLQTSIDELRNEINSIELSIIKNNSRNSNNNDGLNKKNSNQNKTKEEPKSEVDRLMDLIKKSANGKKSILITAVTIKNTYHCTNEVANEIIEKYKKANLYNEKTHILTIK